MTKVIGCYLKQNSDLATLVDLAEEYGIALSNTGDINVVVDETMAFFDQNKAARTSFPWDYGCDFVRVCNECHEWMQEGYIAEGCVIDGILVDGYWCSEKCLHEVVSAKQWKCLVYGYESVEDYEEVLADPDYDEDDEEIGDDAFFTEWYTGETVTMPNGKIVRV